LVHDKLFDRLRQELRLIYGLNVEVITFTDGGLIWLSGSHHHRHAWQLETEINRVLDWLCTGEIPEALAERVRATTLAHHVVRLQSNVLCTEALSKQPQLYCVEAPILYSKRLTPLPWPSCSRPPARFSGARTGNGSCSSPASSTPPRR
jgi:hypothetical protein